MENKEKEIVTEPEVPEEPKANDMISSAKAENDRMTELLTKLKAENDRAEEIAAKKMLGGTSEAGIPAPAPVKISDEEYANQLQRGEVDPLREDGFV